VVLSGELLSYMDGLQHPKKVSIPVPPHTAYTRLTLKMNINATVSGSGSWSGGAYGVKGSASSQDSYDVTFYKQFDPSTPVKIAIGQTFESFVLPLRAKTMEDLANGDYLLHEFDGNLNLSFGAFAGIDQVLYAGNGAADVAAVKGNALATLQASAKPEIKAGVNLDFSFKYTTRYEACVTKQGSVGRLHLSRSSKADATTSATLGLTFCANATGCAKVTQSLAKSATGSEATQLSAKGMDAAIVAGVADVNEKLSHWTSKANGVQVNLQTEIEETKTTTLLGVYEFDLSAPGPGLDRAWKLAMDGDLAAALNYKDAAGKSYVTLDAGSGLEAEYQRKSTFCANFFNLWKFSSWSEWTQNVTMVYAGNNVFHLIANVGRQTESQYIGAVKSINFYFTLAADSLAGAVKNPTATLHIDLCVNADAKAARAIGTLLNAVADSSCTSVAQQLMTFVQANPKGTVNVSFAVGSQSFGAIRADAYGKGMPSSGTNSNPNDERNWQTFVRAADTVGEWWLAQAGGAGQWKPTFESYSGWVTYNVACNGFSSGVASREQYGDWGSGTWPQSWIGFDSNRPAAGVCLRMGQAYLQLCAYLQQLYSATSSDACGTTWAQMLQLAQHAALTDQFSEFPRAATLALLQTCGAVQLENSTVTQGKSPSFQAKLTI
jgi:hypothetical protein